MVTAARKAYKDGDFERAVEIIEQSPGPWRLSPDTVRLARDAYMKLGEISKALGEVNRLRTGSHPESLDRQARYLLGRLIETDPAWSPRVPTLDQPITPTEGVILHLLKESLPYAETGFTFRSRMTLEAQRIAGFEPVVVTSLGFPEYRGDVVEGTQEIVDGVVHHRLKSDRHYPTDFRVPYDMLLDDQAMKTAAIADQVAPSLVQAGSGFRGFDQALIGAAIADRAGVPFIYEVRGFLEATWTSDADRAERGEYYRRRLAQEKRCLDQADHVITIAEAMKEELVARGVPEEKVTVVPNAVDVERFTPREKRADLVDLYRLGDSTVIGYISNLGRREGIEHLVTATKLLIDSGKDVVCLLVGDGPERPDLERTAQKLGVGDRVVFAGHVPNEAIEDHYALIDVFVVPRIVDRASRLVTPLKPLEAMAMGLPTIASDLPALREQVEPDVRGLVFRPGDAADLARALSTLLDDQMLARELASTAQRWVREERTLESNARRYRSVIDALI